MTSPLPHLSTMSANTTLYFSNRGKGPMVARITLIQDGIVYLERKPSINGKRWYQFHLSEKFFNSGSCGWRKRTT